RYAQLSVTFKGEKMCQCGTLQSGRECRSGESGNPLEFTPFDGELILPALARQPQHAHIQRDLTAGEITEGPWVPLSHEGYGHGHVLDMIAVVEGSATFSRKRRSMIANCVLIAAKLPVFLASHLFGEESFINSLIQAIPNLSPAKTTMDSDRPHV